MQASPSSTVTSTLAALAERGCDLRAIFLGDGNAEDRFAIIRDPGGKWEVYYTEHGEKLMKREFDVEDQACGYLVELLNNEGTVWA